MTFRQNKAPSTRQNRVAEVIRECIAKLLVDSDAFILEALSAKVSVSHVKVSADLGVATVFVIPAVGEEQQVLAALNDKEMIAMFRKNIGSELQLRSCPSLRFVQDKSWEYQRDIEEALRRNRQGG